MFYKIMFTTTILINKKYKQQKHPLYYGQYCNSRGSMS